MLYWNDVAKSMISGAYMDGQEIRQALCDVTCVKSHGSLHVCSG